MSRQQIPADTARLIALLDRGAYAAAESAARALVSREPTCGVGWKMLGVARLFQGKSSLDALQAAAQHLPKDPDVHSNLGSALADLGRFEESLASCLRALELNPLLVEALNNQGNALSCLGRLSEAIACYRRVIELRPHDAAAHCNLANALRCVGKPDESLLCCRRALELKPSLAQAHGNAGNALRDLGRWPEALASYAHALEIEPRNLRVLGNLGVALRDLGRLEEAAAVHRRALEIDPNYIEAQVQLGHVYGDLGRLDDAEQSYRRALALNPNRADTHAALAMVLRFVGRQPEAQALCVKALALDPKLAPAQAFLGDLAEDQGRFTVAEQHFRSALALDPQLPQALIGLLRQRASAAEGPGWLAAAQRLAQQPLPLRMLIDLHFALGSHHDERGDFERAFAHFRHANELSKRFGPEFDRQRAGDLVDEIMQRYDVAAVAAGRAAAEHRAPEHGVPEHGVPERAVFVVGMPRSGTTLVEQILASHPAVFGAGESTFWLAAASTPRPDAAGLSQLAGEYRRLMRHWSPDALRVVDKMPSNYLNLGLILAALPGARVIHVVRDPRDTCWSIYRHNFAMGHRYSMDLDDLAHQYRQYARLMQHWRAVLPAGTLLDLPYEGLIAEQEHWSRRLLDFIGLPWDAKCLEFHTTSRTVMTHSKWQVRQPLSRASVGRWRHYERFLGPLRSLEQ